MKVALLTLLAVAGTTIASPIAMPPSRQLPQPGSEAARMLLELVTKGMQSWGLAGAVNAFAGSPGAPSRNMIGGLPELNRPYPPKDGEPGTPGSPLGPRKKQGRIYSRGKSCTKKRGMVCPTGTAATGTTSRYLKLRAAGRGGAMVAFALLSPHAHDILAAVKGWDNPIGRAVAWFDEAMASLQEALGGKHVPEIGGNELQLWLICLLRDENPRRPDSIDEACRRRKDAPAEDPKQQQAIDGLNQVAELCETIEEDPPADRDLRMDVLELCDEFSHTANSMADANAGLVLLGEWARARTLNNQEVEESDYTAVKEFIQQGAFGPVTNETRVGEIASIFMSFMSTSAIVEVEDDNSQIVVNHDEPTAWLELLQMGAGYVPEDREAVNEALQLLGSSPYLDLFDNEGRQSLWPVSHCWDQSGLLAFQPRRWDMVSAAITYLEGRLRNTGSALACAPCMALSDFWVLRCGSAVPVDVAWTGAD